MPHIDEVSFLFPLIICFISVIVISIRNDASGCNNSMLTSYTNSATGNLMVESHKGKDGHID